jgi:PEP-CTERM motif
MNIQRIKTNMTAVVGGCLVLAAPLSQAASSPALSKAVLTSSLVSVTCTLTTPAGTTVVPCSTTGWSPTLQQGWTASMTATYSYAYVDDGLPTTTPFSFQLDANGLRLQPASFEAGALYPLTSGTCAGSRYGCGVPPSFVYGGTPFAPLFLSNDNMPTNTSGTVSITTNATVAGSSPMSWTPRLYIGTFELVNSVPAIPEPSTYALMLGGLCLVAAMARRRAPPSVQR